MAACRGEAATIEGEARVVRWALVVLIQKGVRVWLNHPCILPVLIIIIALFGRSCKQHKDMVETLKKCLDFQQVGECSKFQVSVSIVASYILVIYNNCLYFRERLQTHHQFWALPMRSLSTSWQRTRLLLRRTPNQPLWSECSARLKTGTPSWHRNIGAIADNHGVQFILFFELTQIITIK